MVTAQKVVADATARVGFRGKVRYFAAAMAAIVSGLYILIGFQLLRVIENASDQAAFAIPAGIAFAIGALVILAVDRRALLVNGGIVQALIIAMYFSVSDQREPAFEGWGISIRVTQVLLLAALGYLAVRHRERVTAAASPFRLGKAAT